MQKFSNGCDTNSLCVSGWASFMRFSTKCGCKSPSSWKALGFWDRSHHFYFHLQNLPRSDTREKDVLNNCLEWSNMPYKHDIVFSLKKTPNPHPPRHHSCQSFYTSSFWKLTQKKRATCNILNLKFYIVGVFI